MSKSDQSGDGKNPLYCSFCGKSQHEVKKLIAGPTVFICDECVELCMDIIREENKNNNSVEKKDNYTPQEIFNIEGKSHMSKISTSLRLLDQRGYIKRHRNSPKGPIAYISFTNDGIFIAKTWARVTESNEEDDFKSFDDIEKGFERQDSDSYEQWNQDEEI